MTGSTVTGLLPMPDGVTSEHRLIFYRLIRLEQAVHAAGQRDPLAVRSVWLGRSPNSA